MSEFLRNHVIVVSISCIHTVFVITREAVPWPRVPVNICIVVASHLVQS